MNYKLSITGGIVALFLGTACCWIPALLILIGSATGIVAFSESLQAYSGIFFAIGAGLILFGGYRYFKRKQVSSEQVKLILESAITCPNCGYQKTDTMPTDSCQYFYECDKCHETLKPKVGDCCVYCSYGSVPCPPIQQDKNCC